MLGCHVFILHVFTTCLLYTVIPPQSGSLPQLSSSTSSCGRRKSERRRSPMGGPRGPPDKAKSPGGHQFDPPQVSRSCPYHQSAFPPGMPARGHLYLCHYILSFNFMRPSFKGGRLTFVSFGPGLSRVCFPLCPALHAFFFPAYFLHPCLPAWPSTPLGFALNWESPG